MTRSFLWVLDSGISSPANANDNIEKEGHRQDKAASGRGCGAESD